MPGPKDTAELVVLGAGPAGVAAAYRAASAGHRVVVLEREGRVGGAAGSFEVAGVRVDYGSHRLHPSIRPEILAVLRLLLGDELQRRQRNGRLRLAGRWITFPLRGADLLEALPRSFALAAAADAATSWARRPRADTFAEVLRCGLGPAICESFYFPYARKLWGLEPDEISGEQARRRVSADSGTKLLKRLLRGARPEGRSFYYPRRGYGQITETLARAAADEGAELRLGAPAVRMRLDAGGVRVDVAGGGSVEARRVWSTIPLPVLARIADPPPPQKVLAAGRSLRFRAMLLVYLVLEVDRYTPYDAHYLPGPEIPVSRISEPANYRDADDPPGRTVLCAEIPCSEGDELWRRSPGELAALVVATLRRLDLPPAEPSAVEVRRLANAYPIYRVGYEEAFSMLDEWASHCSNLLTFGRQGLFVHDNTHHALAMAWAAAGALRPGGGFDRAAWADARRRFGAHVVED